MAAIQAEDIEAGLAVAVPHYLGVLDDVKARGFELSGSGNDIESAQVLYDIVDARAQTGKDKFNDDGFVFDIDVSIRSSGRQPTEAKVHFDIRFGIFFRIRSFAKTAADGKIAGVRLDNILSENRIVCYAGIGRTRTKYEMVVGVGSEDKETEFWRSLGQEVLTEEAQ